VRVAEGWAVEVGPGVGVGWGVAASGGGEVGSIVGVAAGEHAVLMVIRRYKQISV